MIELINQSVNQSNQSSTLTAPTRGVVAVAVTARARVAFRVLPGQTQRSSYPTVGLHNQLYLLTSDGQRQRRSTRLDKTIIIPGVETKEPINPSPLRPINSISPSRSGRSTQFIIPCRVRLSSPQSLITQLPISLPPISRSTRFREGKKIILSPALPLLIPHPSLFSSSSHHPTLTSIPIHPHLTRHSSITLSALLPRGTGGERCGLCLSLLVGQRSQTSLPCLQLPSSASTSSTSLQQHPHSSRR